MKRVNGHYIDGKEGKNPKMSTFDVENPATGAVCSSYVDCGEEELNQAVAAAKEAFGTWSSYTVKQRAAVMLKFHALVR